MYELLKRIENPILMVEFGEDMLRVSGVDDEEGLTIVGTEPGWNDGVKLVSIDGIEEGLSKVGNELGWNDFVKVGCVVVVTELGLIVRFGFGFLVSYNLTRGAFIFVVICILISRVGFA